MQRRRKQPESLNDLELDKILDTRPSFVFDTGGVLEIHRRMGKVPIPIVLGTEFFIPSAVIGELERQKRSKRRTSDGTRLCSHHLTSEIYTKVGRGYLTEIPWEVSPKDYKTMRDALKKESNGNSRLGKADAAVIDMALSTPPSAIVTVDSDIGYVLRGLGVNNVDVVSPDRYIAAVIYSLRREE